MWKRELVIEKKKNQKKKRLVAREKKKRKKGYGTSQPLQRGALWQLQRAIEEITHCQ